MKENNCLPSSNHSFLTCGFLVGPLGELEKRIPSVESERFRAYPMGEGLMSHTAPAGVRALAAVQGRSWAAQKPSEVLWPISAGFLEEVDPER